VLSSWSIGGLFFSLGPQLSAIVFDSTNHIVTALSVVLLAGTAAVAQFVFGKSAPWLGTAAGSLALATGLLLIVLAAVEESGALLIVGAIVGGAGFGVAFLGSLRALSVAIPHEHRAQVMSAFYVVAYASLSLPAVLAGIVVTPLGLESTFEIFGTVIAGVALLLAVEATRSRPVVATA
jgi:predicted MFS family arabinose efflux permease